APFFPASPSLGYFLGLCTAFLRRAPTRNTHATGSFLEFSPETVASLPMVRCPSRLARDFHLARTSRAISHTPDPHTAGAMGTTEQGTLRFHAVADDPSTTVCTGG